ncbi:MAG: T9SS type A sorting domain-containing protein [Bacteroidota bacterium]
MKNYFLLLFFASNFYLGAQNNSCPEDPPVNPWLAESAWPTFHRNNAAQASTCIAGPVTGDELVIKSRTHMSGSTSPWVYLSDMYPNGERVLVQSNSTHFFKHIDTPEGIHTIDSLRIDFDGITSFGFAFIQAKDNKWFVPDPKYNPSQDEYSRIIKIEDSDPNDPYSELVETEVFSFEGTPVNKVSHLMLNFDGHLVFTGDTDETNNVAHVGILDQDLNILDILEYSTYPDEIVSHNSSPIENDNSWYLVTTHRLIKFGWDGNQVSIAWEAAYDFVNDGPTGIWAEGSGTTPTFLGYGSDEDKLVVVADGHNQNNLVGFWRELPPGWTGIPGQDIRFADSIVIDAAQASNNQFQSIENSPTAFGYGIAIAQYNGFLGYDCENDKGVQKFQWNTETNTFESQWINEEINMNGVLTYSEGSNLVYSSGKEADCNYYMYGLDWNTGEIAFKHLLGPEGTFFDDPYYDAGNNTIIDENGDLYFPGGASLNKLEKTNTLGVTVNELQKKIILSPNPARNFIKIRSRLNDKIEEYQILDASGKVIRKRKFFSKRIFISNLAEGLYFMKIRSGNDTIVKRFIKR